MPINYYCSIKMNGSDIDMDYNELLLPVIDNETSAPNTGSEVEGQMYYNSSAGNKTMYFYNGTTWVEMDGSGSGVSSFQATDGTYIDYAPNTATTGAVTLTGDLSASGTADSTTFLRGDNTWATPAGSYTSWKLEADSGTAVDITDGLRVDFTGGIGIDTTVASATPNTLTIDLDVNKLTTATPATGDFLAFSDEDQTGDPTRKATISTILALGTQGTLTGIDAGAGIVINDSGTATPEVAVKYAGAADNVIQSATDAEATAIAVGDVIIYSDSTASDAVKRGLVSDLPYDSYTEWKLSDGTTTEAIQSGQTVTLATVADNAAKAGIEPVVSATDTLTLNLDLSNLSTVSTIDAGNDEIAFYDSNNSQNASIAPSDIHLNQWGAAEADVSFGSNKLTNVADGSNSTDGVNLGQVQGLIAGTGLFEGGYNADTGLTTDQSPNGAINGASNIATGLGDFYAVTTAGTQLGVALEVGDLIFANVAIAASSSPANSDFTIVQSGQSIAGEGATDNATTKGIAGFNSAHFNVSSNGWVSADIYGGTSTLGIVPSGGSATTFLRGDGSWVTPTNTQNPDQTISGSGSNNTDSGITLSDSGGTVLVLGAGSVTASQTGNTITLTGTNTTYSAGVGLTLSGTEFNVNVTDSQTTQAPQSITTTTNRLYQVETDDQDNLVVNVPWSDTNTNLVTSVAADTTLAYKGIRVDPTTGAVKVGLDINGLTENTSPAEGDFLAIYDISGTAENKKVTVKNIGDRVQKLTTMSQTLSAFTTGTTVAANAVVHNFNTFDVMVQLYDETSKETIHACVDRANLNYVTVTGNSYPSSNITVVVTKIG